MPGMWMRVFTMNELAESIASETEYKIPFKVPDKITIDVVKKDKIEQSIAIIERSLKPNRKPCLAFSGGSDSSVLLDLMCKAGYKPVIIWADSQMEYPGTQEYIENIASGYGLDLKIAISNRTPLEQWEATGWPMLGKLAARLWMQKNRGIMGFRINVSECCRAIKIVPARLMTKKSGCNVQITGQRGKADDNLRGLRNIKDGDLYFQVKDNVWVANPLSGWTDAEIKGYIQENKLPEHPARTRGAKTIGCVYCGGGCQYTNSGYRVLRKTWPEAWYRFMVEWEGGLIILALRHKTHLYHIRMAVKEIGGLDYIAKNMPWLFDFTRKKPILGYNK